jgi:chromosomal replication initiator protein
MSKTWKKCLETLKDTVPVGQFSVWIKPLKTQEKNGTLTILAPNDSAVMYLKKNLKQKIKTAIAQHDKSLKILIGVVAQPQAKKQHTTPLLDDYTFENLKNILKSFCGIRVLWCLQQCFPRCCYRWCCL